MITSAMIPNETHTRSGLGSMKLSTAAISTKHKEEGFELIRAPCCRLPPSIGDGTNEISIITGVSVRASCH